MMARTISGNVRIAVKTTFPVPDKNLGVFLLRAAQNAKGILNKEEINVPTKAMATVQSLN